MKKIATAIGAGAAALVVPFVMTHEGLRTKAYRDPIDIATVCYGHTGKDVKAGQSYTPAQCQAMLEEDLANHAEYLSCIKTPLQDGQKAAFVSFIYNVGGAKFCGSTLVKKANAGDLRGACNELLRWTMAGGRELPGLVTRRTDEHAMCLKGLT